MTVQLEPVSQMQQEVLLHYTDGRTSDKIYKIRLHVVGDQWAVSTYYGKRGAENLNRGVGLVGASYTHAHGFFQRTLKEKIGKGYIVVDRTLTPVKEKPIQKLDELILNPEWWARPLHSDKDIVIKTGNRISLKSSRNSLNTRALRELHRYDNDFELVVAAVDDVLVILDLLSFAGQDMRKIPYGSRFLSLERMPVEEHVRLVATQKTSAAKSDLLRMARVSKWDGIEFVKWDTTGPDTYVYEIE